MNLRYAFQSESKLYFVMNYYRGGDLNHHLQKRGHFSDVEAKFIAAQIALAIGCLHSHGIIYRDLKPENVLTDDLGCDIQSVSMYMLWLYMAVYLFNSFSFSMYESHIMSCH